MRTSILAKWTVLFGVAGVVFGLGVGSASAQIEYDGTGTQLEVAEGGRVAIKYRLRTYVAAGAAAAEPSFGFAWANTPTGPGSTTDGVGGNNIPTESEGIDVTGRTFIVNIPAGGAEAGAVTVRGEFILYANQDADAEDELGQVNVTAAGSIRLADNSGDISTTATKLVLVRINDSETPEFEWVKQSPAPALREGASSAQPYHLRIKQAVEDETWANINLIVDKTGYRVTPAAITINNTNAATPRPFTIEIPDNDGNRVDDQVTLRATYGGKALSGLDPVTMTFEDVHALPEPAAITWKAYTDNDGKPSTTEATSIAEGGPPVHVTVTVDRGTKGYPLNEALEVTPMSDSPSYRLEGVSGGALSIESGTGEKSGTFMVYRMLDDDIVAEDLVLNLRVTGAESDNGAGSVMAAKPFTLPVEDGTMPLLTPKSDEEIMATVAAARTASASGADGAWRPGDMFTLGRSDLFEESDNPISLAAESSDPTVVGVSVRDDTLTVTAAALGTATVTVTGTAASAVVMQTRSNLAVIEFDLTVDRLPMGITLSGPEDMNLAEGDSAMVTATANDPVTADTTVELRLAGGTASPDDYSVDSIMLRTGETTGTARLTAREDRTKEGMETLVIEGHFGDGMKTNALTFNLWDAAVPALPVVAQLLLAAFLAVAGARRLRRR